MKKRVESFIRILEREEEKVSKTTCVQGSVKVLIIDYNNNKYPPC